jgi:transposase IS116/IS110/IS902 family protein
VELLAKAPTPAAAAKLTITQISAALKRARRRDIPGKAAAIQTALRTEHLGQADIVATAYAASVRAMVAIPQTLNTEIATLESQVGAHFGQHPDAKVYLSQPGIGVILGARVLAEFGDAPGRYADAKSRKNCAGTAPITRQSGKSKTVHARFIHNDRLVDALHLQAGAAILHDPAVRAHYDELRAREIGHNAALRRSATASSASCTAASNQQPLQPDNRLVTPIPTPRYLTSKLLGCLTLTPGRPPARPGATPRVGPVRAGRCVAGIARSRPAPAPGTPGAQSATRQRIRRIRNLTNTRSWTA